MIDNPTTIDLVRDSLNGHDIKIPPPHMKAPRPLQRAMPRQVLLDEETIKKKEEMRESLKQGIYTVEFMKVTGEPATMECTLHEGLLPPALDETPSPRTELPHLLVVYSTDRLGWRSFDVRRVTRFEKHPSVE